MCCAIHTKTQTKKTQSHSKRTRYLVPCFRCLRINLSQGKKNCKVKKTNERCEEKCDFRRYSSTAVRVTTQINITISRTARKSKRSAISLFALTNNSEFVKLIDEKPNCGNIPPSAPPIRGASCSPPSLRSGGCCSHPSRAPSPQGAGSQPYAAVNPLRPRNSGAQ